MITTAEVDLNGAATVGEVLDRLQAGFDTAPGIHVHRWQPIRHGGGADDLVIAGVAGNIGSGLGLEGTFAAGTTTGGDTQPAARRTRMQISKDCPASWAASGSRTVGTCKR